MEKESDMAGALRAWPIYCKDVVKGLDTIDTYANGSLDEQQYFQWAWTEKGGLG